MSYRKINNPDDASTSNSLTVVINLSTEGIKSVSLRQQKLVQLAESVSGALTEEGDPVEFFTQIIRLRCRGNSCVVSL